MIIEELNMVGETQCDESQLTERKTNVLKTTDLGIEVLYPENVLLKFADEIRVSPFDIGSIAYTERKEHPEFHKKGLFLVNPDSLNHCRCEFLRKLFDSIYCSSNRDTTVKSEFEAIKQVIDWADQHGHSNLLDSVQAARRMYQAYSTYLNQGIKAGTLGFGRRTANAKQRALKAMLGIQYGMSALSDIIEGVVVIISERNPTKPPREKEKNAFVSVCLAVARQFGEFTLSGDKFPFPFNTPDYKTYVFPSNGGNMITPHSPKAKLIYNCQLGRISTVDEYIEKKKYERNTKRLSEAKRAVNDAQQNLNTVNSTERHEHKLQVASLAIQAYTQLFIIITGSQPSELVTLEFDERYELDRDLFKSDFRAVKFRAAGRVVQYSLGDIYGYQIIKEYLALRKWMLNGEECQYLFFKNSKERGGGYKDQFKQLALVDVGRFYKRAKGLLIAEHVKNIPASKARKYRSVVLHELRQDPLVIAAWQNHKLSTSLRDYSETTDDRSSEQFSSFWKAVIDTRNRIKIKFVESTGQQDADIPSGHCEDNGNPSSIVESPLIEPNCNTQLGCLFCEHYCLHADEEDLRKLFSLLFVVQEIRKFSSNFGHAESLYKELTVKVKSLILSIKERSDGLAQLAEKVEYEVMELGSINEFWNNKLARFERLGVVF
ncbi:hypothetical protein D210916BOD24_00290 [Alteromonas sp. D210916BOD_24]|uniref:hypothetical protein n=1 Tax=Alteromonas sp. D210916BOD_24 TaxID=3157618 RepID=UPI00399C7F88